MSEYSVWYKCYATRFKYETINKGNKTHCKAQHLQGMGNRVGYQDTFFALLLDRQCKIQELPKRTATLDNYPSIIVNLELA